MFAFPFNSHRVQARFSGEDTVTIWNRAFVILCSSEYFSSTRTWRVKVIRASRRSREPDSPTPEQVRELVTAALRGRNDRVVLV